MHAHSISLVFSSVQRTLVAFEAGSVATLEQLSVATLRDRADRGASWLDIATLLDEPAYKEETERWALRLQADGAELLVVAGEELRLDEVGLERLFALPKLTRKLAERIGVHALVQRDDGFGLVLDSAVLGHLCPAALSSPCSL